MENTIGDRIRKHRKKRKLTQEKLAELCSVSPPTISRWENGSLKPSFEHQQQLTNILKIEFPDSNSSPKKEPDHSEIIQDIVVILSKMSENEQELVLNLILDLEQFIETN